MVNYFRLKLQNFALEFAIQKFKWRGIFALVETFKVEKTLVFRRFFEKIGSRVEVFDCIKLVFNQVVRSFHIALPSTCFWRNAVMLAFPNFFHRLRENAVF